MFADIVCLARWPPFGLLKMYYDFPIIYLLLRARRRRRRTACGVLDDGQHDDRCRCRCCAPADILNTHFLHSLFYSDVFAVVVVVVVVVASSSSSASTRLFYIYIYVLVCAVLCWISRAHDTTFTISYIA